MKVSFRPWHWALWSRGCVLVPRVLSAIAPGAQEGPLGRRASGLSLFLIFSSHPPLPHGAGIWEITNWCLQIRAGSGLRKCISADSLAAAIFAEPLCFIDQARSSQERAEQKTILMVGRWNSRGRSTSLENGLCPGYFSADVLFFPTCIFKEFVFLIFCCFSFWNLKIRLMANDYYAFSEKNTFRERQ